MDAIYDLLDLDHDGALSNLELHTAARLLNWHWYQAPVFALLDLLTTPEPLPKKEFNECFQQLADDPLGPYGNVLLKTHRYLAAFIEKQKLVPKWQDQDNHLPRSDGRAPSPVPGDGHKRAVFPEAGINSKTNDNITQWLDSFGTCRLLSAKTAVLIIDPQRSFTEGTWRQSIGPGGKEDTRPIRMAFDNCERFLQNYYGRLEILFSRCPFPPDSYVWDSRPAKFIDKKQPYFIKPGNSIFFPPTNGFKEWVARCVDNGKCYLVLGGCTLNSCVRVSAIETQGFFSKHNLQVIVDLSLCGARAANFIPTQQYDGLSGAASAVRQMKAAGASVVSSVQLDFD